jgi:outer membrane protein assembly factor BamB
MARSPASRSRRAGTLVALAALVLSGIASGANWPLFGYDPGRHGAGPASGITPANLSRLARRQIPIPGTVDSSPIAVGGLVVMTTSYGTTFAVDAASGRIRWRFTPPGYSSWAGSAQITNSSPAADPGGGSVYVGAPDGRVRKLALATGRVLWTRSITRDPAREKLGTALNVAGRYVVATTGGYSGDAPPYQGHVAVIDRRTGRLVNVWNSLCSDRRGLIEPASCSTSDSGIWGRAGAVVDPATGNLLVATGNGPWDGKTNWGDSVLVLTPDGGRLIASWTPATQERLDSGDVDLGSTSPALLPGGLAVQGGKDALLRLLDVRTLGLGKLGGEIQTIGAPGGSAVFTAPAVWGTRLFVATFSATAAYRLERRRLRKVWERSTPGTSPVVSGGLLYVYDPNGALDVYAAASGRLLRTLPAGRGHWNSPIVVGGRIFLPEGNANDHAQTGVLDVYSLR